MDDADIAGEKQQFMESLPRPVFSMLPLTGFCYNCEEPLDNKKFCGPDCRDDWEMRNVS